MRSNIFHVASVVKMSRFRTAVLLFLMIATSFAATVEKSKSFIEIAEGFYQSGQFPLDPTNVKGDAKLPVTDKEIKEIMEHHKHVDQHRKKKPFDSLGTLSKVLKGARDDESMTRVFDIIGKDGVKQPAQFTSLKKNIRKTIAREVSRKMYPHNKDNERFALMALEKLPPHQLYLSAKNWRVIHDKKKALKRERRDIDFEVSDDHDDDDDDDHEYFTSSYSAKQPDDLDDDQVMKQLQADTDRLFQTPAKYATVRRKITKDDDNMKLRRPVANIRHNTRQAKRPVYKSTSRHMQPGYELTRYMGKSTYEPIRHKKRPGYKQTRYMERPAYEPVRRIERPENVRNMERHDENMRHMERHEVDDEDSFEDYKDYFDNENDNDVHPRRQLRRRNHRFDRQDGHHVSRNDQAQWNTLNDDDIFNDENAEM